MTDIPNLCEFVRGRRANSPTILIVDDNQDNLYLLSQILEYLGYPFLAADSGRTMLELLGDRLPALILLDIVLGDCNGLDLVRQLKRDPHTRDIPTIAVTALALKEEREQIFAAGCDDYISKPFDLADLEQRLQMYLAPWPLAAVPV